ncbi:MAG: hypothetical protein CSA95_08380 [Bacteroidetes bacterium]|nr:MAG: hypothetical protein CSA95_08380 [Bacteroidota bacterium]
MAGLLFSLQFTFMKRKAFVLFWLLLSGVALRLFYPYALEISNTEIMSRLNDATFIGDFLVIQIFEVFFGLLISIFFIRLHYGSRERKILAYASYFPGVVVFLSLFYLQSSLFLEIRGISYNLLAWMMVFLIPLALWGFSWLMKWLLPVEDLRLEIKFILHIFQLVIAVVVSVMAFSLPVRYALITLPWRELGVLFAAAFLIILSGVVYYPYQCRIRNKKRVYESD